MPRSLPSHRTARTLLLALLLTVPGLLLAPMAQAAAPAAPTSVEAVPGPGAGEITVTWSAPTGGGSGLRYEVIRCSGSCTGVLASTAEPRFVDAGLTPSQQAYYGVRTVDGAGGRSPWAYSPVYVTTFDLVPSEVRTTPGPGAGEITLSWSAPLQGATGLLYEWTRCTGGGACTSAAAVGANLTYVDARLPPGREYFHGVRARDAHGHASAWAYSAVYVRTFDLVPRNVTSFAGPGAGVLTVSWSPPERGAPDLRYELIRCGGSCTSPITVGTNLTYLDARLPPDREYYHGVRAVDALGHVSAWAYSAVYVGTFDLVPRNVTPFAGPGAGELTLSWEPPARGAPGLRYEIVRCGGSCTSPIAVGTNLTYVDARLPPDRAYYHGVRAIDALGRASAWAYSAVYVSTFDLVPRNVTSFEGPGAGELTVSWSPPAEGAAGLRYEVVRCGGSCTSPIAVGTNLTYVDAGLPPGREYYHGVRAVDALGHASAWAYGEVYAKVPGARSEPAPPQALDLRWVQGPKAGQATLRWDLSGAASATTFVRVHARACGSCPSQLLATLPGDATSFVEETRAPGSTRSYAVTLVNAGGESAPTPWVSVRLPAPTPSAVSVAPENTAGGLRLLWNAPAGPAEGLYGFRLLRGCVGCALAPHATLPADARRYDDRDLAPGQRMQYALVPLLAGGASATSAVRNNTAPSPTPRDIAVAASPDGGGVDVSWRAPEKAAGSVAGYLVLRRFAGTATPQPFAALPAGQTRFTDATLPPGKSAQYAVVTLVDGGQVPNATWRWAAPAALAPRFVTATPDASGERVNVSWLPPTVGAARVVAYRVSWTPCAGCPEEPLLVTPNGATAAVLEKGLQARAANLTVRALTNNSAGAPGAALVPLTIHASNLAVLANPHAWVRSGGYRDLLHECPTGPCGQDLQAWPAPNAGIRAVGTRTKVCDFAPGNDNATFGCVECVDLARGLSGHRELVTRWTKGPAVMAGGVAPGTVVATFRGPGNTYPTAPPYGHVAIFAGYEPDGRSIRLWSMNWLDGGDSYVREHVVRLGGSGVADAARYSVVSVPLGSFGAGA